MTRPSPAPSNLLFLMSIASLGTGCIIIADDGNDTDDDGADSTPKDLTTGDTGEETDTPPNDGTGTTGEVTSMDDSTGTPETTGETSSTGGAVDPCPDYANTYAECVGDPKAYDAALTSCNNYVEYGFGYSEACGSAYEDYIVCLSALDCEMFFETGVCPDEQEKIADACPAA